MAGRVLPGADYITGLDSQEIFAVWKQLDLMVGKDRELGENRPRRFHFSVTNWVNYAVF